jgi:hypothetical protein
MVYDITMYKFTCHDRVILEKSMGFFCWKWVRYVFLLVVLHTTTVFYFHYWCILKGSIRIWMKSNLVLFIENQMHLSN